MKLLSDLEILKFFPKKYLFDVFCLKDTSIFTCGGGQRMHESPLALAQMTRTTMAINDLKENKLPYIVCLTDPTAGGITASLAMLGDLQISEPGALIAFAGRRVIEGTVKEELPENFQKAEHVLFWINFFYVSIIIHNFLCRDF